MLSFASLGHKLFVHLLFSNLHCSPVRLVASLSFYTWENWGLCLNHKPSNSRAELDVIGCPLASTGHALCHDALLNPIRYQPQDSARPFICDLIYSFWKQEDKRSALGLDVWIPILALPRREYMVLSILTTTSSSVQWGKNSTTNVYYKESTCSLSFYSHSNPMRMVLIPSFPHVFWD